MAYLTQSDYRKQIQDGNLDQVTGSNTSILESAQLLAQEEAINYLKQKYDVEGEFTDTVPYDPTRAYKAGERAVIDFPAYDPTKSYSVNSLVVNAGKGYICTASTTGVFDATKWTIIGNQYDIFYVTYPHDTFDRKSFYKRGDIIFYKDNVYTCLIPSSVLSSSDALQYTIYSNIPAINVFPNNPVYGVQYWGAPVSYSIPAGTLPTDKTKWTKGDNRDQNLVEILIDITLYKIHKRISPRNIPALREVSYMGQPEDRAKFGGKVLYPSYSALGKLQAYANGDLTPDIQELQVQTNGDTDGNSGSRVRYGGNVKVNNIF